METELRAAERRRDEYEKLTASESESQGRDLKLEGNQIKEYQKLKEKAAKTSARHMAELDSTNREHKSVQDRMDTETRKKEEIESKLKTKVISNFTKKKRIPFSNSRIFLNNFTKFFRAMNWRRLKNVRKN